MRFQRFSSNTLMLVCAIMKTEKNPQFSQKIVFPNYDIALSLFLVLIAPSL